MAFLKGLVVLGLLLQFLGRFKQIQGIALRGSMKDFHTMPMETC